MGLACPLCAPFELDIKLKFAMNYSMVFHFKRKIHEAPNREAYWLSRSPSERIAAVEKIRLSDTIEHAQQTFPRVHRIVRRTRG